MGTTDVAAPRMAATFRENRSQIQAILEPSLAVAVPKLYSVGLISEEGRDLALDVTFDNNTRAMFLTGAVESNIVNYQDLLVFVYALLSSVKPQIVDSSR